MQVHLRRVLYPRPLLQMDSLGTFSGHLLEGLTAGVSALRTGSRSDVSEVACRGGLDENCITALRLCRNDVC